MNCSQCGAEAPSGGAFCSQCGAQLTSAPADGGTRDVPSPAQRVAGSRRGGAGNLAPEQDLWVGSYSAKDMAGPFIGMALLAVVATVLVLVSGRHAVFVWLGIGVLIAWGVLGLVLLYRRATVKYWLTNYRLFHERGFLSRTRDRIEVIDIDDVTITQGLMERLFNVGTIQILASDETLKNDKDPAKDGRLIMRGIENVKTVADLIDDTRRNERNRRSVYLENV
jgi:membrane protein YdbS with pleckstrin-like domain